MARCAVILVRPCCLCFSLLPVLGFVAHDVVKNLRKADAAELFQRFHYFFPLFFSLACFEIIVPKSLFFVSSTFIDILYRLLYLQNMDIMKASEPTDDQNALKESDIGRTPTGMNSIDNEVFVCVLFV